MPVVLLLDAVQDHSAAASLAIAELEMLGVAVDASPCTALAGLLLPLHPLLHLRPQEHLRQSLPLHPPPLSLQPLAPSIRPKEVHAVLLLGAVQDRSVAANTAIAESETLGAAVDASPSTALAGAPLPQPLYLRLRPLLSLPARQLLLLPLPQYLVPGFPRSLISIGLSTEM